MTAVEYHFASWRNWNCHLAYLCRFTYQVLYLYLFFTDESPKPWIDVTNTPIFAGQQANLTCYFIYFWALNPTFNWFLADKQVDGHRENRFKYANGSASFRSVLLYIFTRKEDRKTLTCSVSVEEEKSNRTSYRNTSSLILNIHCMLSHVKAILRNE